MSVKLIYHIVAILLLGFVVGCKDIMEPSLSKRSIVANAPSNNFESKSYAINFWWDEMDDALSYRLQVVKPSFGSIAGLVLDTVIKINRFTYTFNPGNYEWRVLAQNGSSQSPYSSPKNFTVLTTSVSEQKVQLNSPANNLLTNKAATLFQWGSLYGAASYNLQIDTNNFSDENTLVYNQTIPGLQVNFTFDKDQTYQWRVMALNDTAKSLWSDIRIITYDNTPPAQAVLKNPENAAQASLPVAMQWSAVAGSNYKLYVYKSDATTLYNNNFPITLSTNNYSFNLGSIGDRIYWKVVAVDAAGNEGQASTMFNFSIK